MDSCGFQKGSTEDPSSVVKEAGSSASTNIEVLSFNHNQQSNNPPLDNAWVGLSVDADDREHDDRWRWLRILTLIKQHCRDSPKECGVRLFSDSGYTLHERTDFEILEGHKNEVWMQDAEYGDQRLRLNPSQKQIHKTNHHQQIKLVRLVKSTVLK